LKLRFRPRVIGSRARTHWPSTRTQSADERVTIPKPQYDQNWRLVRNRCGVMTIGSICATRIGPSPGKVARVRETA